MVSMVSHGRIGYSLVSDAIIIESRLDYAERNL
jgi:hypothetical protein